MLEPLLNWLKNWIKKVICKFKDVDISRIFYCVLHVCGGDPVINAKKGMQVVCSPRMWRWSSMIRTWSNRHLVFSTYVEVILLESWAFTAAVCVLHVCGGDPRELRRENKELRCSPRMWRWSPSMRILSNYCHVFSTYVEVILSAGTDQTIQDGVLHVCGGDPYRCLNHCRYC